ncbi:synaptonemal complex protein 3-like [Echinops telfairi]|uniref:Synaptonemal complex protein 3-like n=1 Tax=Echinops telfairi TaxID=9371 RepID=A0AC55DRU2_ECHTE|nr:synaptonemal complex protein 3-like [Echinops telfairi]
MEKPGSHLVETYVSGTCDQPHQGPIGSEDDGMEGNSPVTDHRERKRPLAGADARDVGEEAQNMLEHFGEALMAKRRKLESIPDTCVENTNQKSGHVLKTQGQWQQLIQEYLQQCLILAQQLQMDLKETEEEEAKLENIFQHQQKFIKQARSLLNYVQQIIEKLYQQSQKDQQEKGHQSKTVFLP